MTTAVSAAGTALSAEAIGELAVWALRAEADLTPKPGLVDCRGPGAHADMNLAMLHASAEALRPAFVRCADAARQWPVGPELRSALGAIGRAGERDMLAATGGVNTHRGALWAIGLLSAAAVVATGSESVADVAARLAMIPDPALVHRTPTATSHGALARHRYGVPGATGEAQQGFPHVLQRALPTLHAARRAGADEDTARLDALLALMSELDDTCLLHRGGPAGLLDVQAAARAVLASGGYRTPAGRRLLADLDDLCARHRWSPGGSGDLLSATLFLDNLDERTDPPCKR
jgi:triphosphoribosyl-dephospho-CoA synthase